MFLSFDGIDGVGKSTQMELFSQHLRELGHEVVTCRDPGSSELGEAIRDILLRDRDTPICGTSEMLLYMASRAQLVAQVIRPALEAGKVVVSDRYLLANVVYQGHAGDLEPDAIWHVGHLATGGIEPDMTILLDMPPGKAGQRLSRELDRMESRGEAYRERLRKGFLAEAAKNPGGIIVIDADGSVNDVEARIWMATSRLLA